MSSFDGLRVNHAGLDQAAADMHAKVKEIEGRLDRLERELEPLRSSWSGQAQETYRLAKLAWDKAMEEMKDLLDRSSKTVYESNAQYKGTDARAASRFQL